MHILMDSVQKACDVKIQIRNALMASASVSVDTKTLKLYVLKVKLFEIKTATVEFNHILKQCFLRKTMSPQPFSN